MNISNFLIDKSCSFLLIASSLLFFEMPAQAINIALDSSNYTVNLGVGNNSTSPTSPINTGMFSNGFGFENHFSERFLLLGALANDSNIPNDSLDYTNSRATSTVFTLSSSDVSQNINISFKWAFNGNATGGSNDQDNFNISLVGATNKLLLTQALPGGYGKSFSTATISGGTLRAGNYRLRINVNENDDFDLHSSAAGFDNFQISSTPVLNIPFEFSPAQGLMIVGSFWALSNLIKGRKKMSYLSKNFFDIFLDD